jgi:three-Cys-motif partner protein
MPSDTENFFEGKRPWSKIKDRILGSYLTPYTAKIFRKGKDVFFIDAFAGPGKFGDNLPGSPLLMCQAAEKYASGHYQAIFMNNKLEHHETLKGILEAGGWYPAAQAWFGDSRKLLREIGESLEDQSVLLYLDPFGIKDCEFDLLNPFINRNPKYSTEIIINLSMPIIHRMAGRQAIQDGTMNADLQLKWSDKLSRVLGGNYWKDILLSSNSLDTKSREALLVDGYMGKISENGYLNFTGACPIQASRESATKYYMIFASPHRDARELFNDGMLRAFNSYMHEQEMRDTLFADLSWEDWRDSTELRTIIIDFIHKYPGRMRIDLWHRILERHFLRYTSSEYKKEVTNLFEEGYITTPTKRPTKKLNDDCRLYLSEGVMQQLL